MAEQPSIINDRYEIIKHVARGGMAQVYLARDLLLDRNVALKVLFPELSVDRSFVERFRREAKAAANLSHPNIVSVYDWGQGEHTYYIVMEFVDGPTLSQVLRQGPLAPERAAAIAASVAAALDFAHRRGVIHRDVKPGNVLIDDRAQVKVADFGIARAAGTSDDLTQTGSVMGTATYFSPEQAQGYSVDPRSDVYSLGVVLYEMVAGRPPFSGENPVSIAYKHVKEPPPPPSEVNPSVPPALEAVILKAMSKEPAARYQTAEEMRADLFRFTNGQPVSAAAEMAAATNVMGAVGGPPTAVLSRTALVPPVGGPPPEERSRAGLYALIALVLLALALGGYFGGKQAGLFGTSAKTLTVPGNLAGQTQAAAQSELAKLGFKNVSTASKNSSTVPKGNVISTQPPGGTTVKSSDPITLNISSGPATVSVPTVQGATAAQANAAIHQAGLKPQDVPAYSDSVAPGTVISTNPSAGTQVPAGSKVQVAVSSGKQPVKVPSVAGDSQVAAGQALGAVGLNVGGTTNQASTTVQAGDVIGTQPAAGTPVAAGSSVTLYISTGPPTTTVPSVVGDTQSQAEAAMTNANLKSQVATVPVSSQSQNGVVQSTNPPAQSTEPQGTTVTLYVGSYTPPSTTTTTTSTTVPTSGGGTSGQSVGSSPTVSVP